MVANAQMISKIYFPRLAPPIGARVVSFVDFGISFLVLLLLMLVFRYPPNWRMVTLADWSRPVRHGLGLRKRK